MTDGRLILIVDDQTEVLRIFSRGLEVAGYRVVTAETAEAGLLMIEAERPEAVVVDLKMPFVNGMGMLYRLRKAYPRLPVAIVTGMQNLDADTLQEVAMLDAVVHYKPLSIAQIQRAVDDLLTRK